MADFHDITIALAGLCQSASLVQQFAHKGEADSALFHHSLKSLLVTAPESTLAVYDNNLANLSLGIETVLAQFNASSGKFDAEVQRYCIGLLAVSQKLAQNAPAKTQLICRLAQLESQAALCENDLLSESLISNIAHIYRDLISPLGSQIKVFGPRNTLMRPEIQVRIRACLLTGIRAAILWQQVGGSRWQFLFSRHKIRHQAQLFYKSL